VTSSGFKPETFRAVI